MKVYKATGEREQQSRTTVLICARRNERTALMMNLMLLILSFDTLSSFRKILAMDAEETRRASGKQAVNAIRSSEQRTREIKMASKMASTAEIRRLAT